MRKATSTLRIRPLGASVELSEWLLGGCRAGTPERTAVRDGVRFGGQRRRRRSATCDFYYWQNADAITVNISARPDWQGVWLLGRVIDDQKRIHFGISRLLFGVKVYGSATEIFLRFVGLC